MSDPSFQKTRLKSLDVFRGLTMFLLLAEAAGVYDAFTDYFNPSSFGGHFIHQFHHHPWNGLRFWDLIQPYFMFIVGVAMPFSLKKRKSSGHSWQTSFRHILFRCMMLFLFGTGLHCVYNGELVWELWNVLTQLSFTILVTFFLLSYSLRTQAIASVIFLILAEVLYRMYDPGSPFVKGENMGSFTDMLFMDKINGGGWVTINCISTAAHTIWGAMCAKVLLSQKDGGEKLKSFIAIGLLLVVLGYAMDFLGLVPIIKRIATTSFVIVSGGWAILTLAFFYWFVDLKGVSNWTKMFSIVGMNSIFIYLFAETIGAQWLRKFIKIFVEGVLNPIGLSELAIDCWNGLVVLAVMWYLCYFLYQKKIFFRI